MNWLEVLSGLALLHVVMASVAVTMGMLSGRKRILDAAAGLLFAVSLFQTGFVVYELMHYQFADMPRFVYLDALAWLLAITSLIVWRRERLRGLTLITTPFTLLIILAALLIEGHAAPPRTAGLFFNLHIACMFASLALMALACGAGLFFVIEERAIKLQGSLSAFVCTLPSLSLLDKINALTAYLIFPLYSLGVLFGMVSARLTWGSLLSGDLKELISLICWGLSALLLHQRLGKGWRGRKPALLAVALFAVALVSLFGVNLLAFTHHSFLAR